jgi:small conductance mechanosensitive channel
MITHPVRVMRNSGTLLYVELSLGYDIPRHEIEKILLSAATETGLESPFVQIRNLGDFSVTYRISGLLTEVNRLLAKRRELRRRTMDGLHEADVEIVSPTFMNTRAFDKEEAESVTKLREKLEATQERIKACAEIAAEEGKPDAAEAAKAEIEKLEKKVERLTTLIDRKEAKISEE